MWEPPGREKLDPNRQAHGLRTGNTVGTGFGDRTVTMLGSFTLARRIHSVITDPHL